MRVIRVLDLPLSRHTNGTVGDILPCSSAFYMFANLTSFHLFAFAHSILWTINPVSSPMDWWGPLPCYIYGVGSGRANIKYVSQRLDIVVRHQNSQYQQLSHIPTIGPTAPLLTYWGAMQFFFKGKELVNQGYQKVSNKHRTQSAV